MNICVMCGKEVSTERFTSVKAACPHCDGDLHVCLNCRFYSKASHNQCLEARAEFQRSRDRANFCEYFEYRDSPAPSRSARGGDLSIGGGSADSKDDVKKKFDDLFKD